MEENKSGNQQTEFQVLLEEHPNRISSFVRGTSRTSKHDVAIYKWK